MQWSNPEPHLDQDAIFDLLVIRGLDDWLQSADFFDVARHAHPSTEEEYRSTAVTLAKRLLVDGLAVAGDLSGGEHLPWDGSVDEQLSRLSNLWMDPDADPRFAFVWFELTASGMNAAEEALEQVPDVE
jgi:hypothetical protein